MSSKKPGADLHTPTILVVDDDRMDVELILDAFTEVGVSASIRVARSGAEALEQTLSPTDPLRPDLVLLDIKMPGLDGHQVLERFRQAPTMRRVPVVVFSSSAEESDVARSYDGGANAYIRKPASWSGYVDIVRAIDVWWLGHNVSPPTP